MCLCSISSQDICSVTSVVSDSLQPRGPELPGSSVHGIFQARTLVWVALPFPTQGQNFRLLHLLHCRWILYHSVTWEALPRILSTDLCWMSWLNYNRAQLCVDLSTGALLWAVTHPPCNQEAVTQNTINGPLGLLRWCSDKESACQCRKLRIIKLVLVRAENNTCQIEIYRNMLPDHGRQV